MRVLLPPPLLLLALQFINSQQPQPEPRTQCHATHSSRPFCFCFFSLLLLSFARLLRPVSLAAFHMRFPYCCRYVICSESAAAAAKAAPAPLRFLPATPLDLLRLPPVWQLPSMSSRLYASLPSIVSRLWPISVACPALSASGKRKSMAARRWLAGSGCLGGEEARGQGVGRGAWQRRIVALCVVHFY